MSVPGGGGQPADAADAAVTFHPRDGGYAYHGIFHGAYLRVPDIIKHVCVAVRIGDGKAPGKANTQCIRKTSNAASADSNRNPSGWHEFWLITLSQATNLDC
jgi:hypothetical protein